MKSSPLIKQKNSDSPKYRTTNSLLKREYRPADDFSTTAFGNSGGDGLGYCGQMDSMLSCNVPSTGTLRSDLTSRNKRRGRSGK